MSKHKPTDILLVEDNPGDARLFRQALKDIDPNAFIIHSAERLSEALALLSHGRFDAIFLDLHLPDGEGLDLVHKVHGHRPEIPLIILTGTNDDQLGPEAVHSGAQDYLVKGKAAGKEIVRALQFAVERHAGQHRRFEELMRFTQYAVDNAGESIFWINSGGGIIYANKKAGDRSGYSRHELMHLKIYDVYLETTAEKWPEFWMTFHENQPVTFDSTQRHKEGAVSPVEITINRVGFAGEEYNCTFIRDITERKRAEEVLRQSEERLRLSQRLEAVGRLAGGIAHDFNNLLTVIKGYSELIEVQLSPDDPKRLDLLEIQKAAERAASLTRQLLAFSRKQVLQPKILNLNAVVSDLEKMLRRLTGEDIQFSFHLQPDLGLIKADPTQMEQILLNLVVNARDAMPKGGKITIESSTVSVDEAYCKKLYGMKPGRHVMLAVTDTGEGIEKEIQSHIFEPFFTTKSKDKGTGLGLSTVYGIVKQSGGYIWLYSEVGKGSTFKVYLPIVEGLVDYESPSPPKIIHARGSETIMLVEDDAAIRRLVQVILEKNGYRLLVADDVHHALRIMSDFRNPIHLLISDVIMPDMSGPDLAEKLRAFQPRMKVLFMSGYPDSAISQHGILNPEVPFLQKPFTPDGLITKVREIFG